MTSEDAKKPMKLSTICLRCKKSAVTFSTDDDIPYTNYSYCEDCLRAGLKLLKAKSKIAEQPESAKEYCAECNHIEMCKWYPFEGCEFRDLPKDEREDAVSRADAIEEVHKAIYDFFDIVDDDSESPITHKDEVLLSANKAITAKLKALPSVMPKRKVGKWVKYDGRNIWYCSCCLVNDYYAYIYNRDVGGYEIQDNFCPNCGARMDGEDDEAN